MYIQATLSCPSMMNNQKKKAKAVPTRPNIQSQDQALDGVNVAIKSVLIANIFIYRCS